MLNYFLEKKNYLILFFTIGYLAAFSINGIAHANFEFLYYTFLISFLIYLVVTIHQKLHLAFFILFNLSLLGFLHLLGGNFYLSTDLRLYDFYIIPKFFRYDNFVHAYTSFIATIALYSLLRNFVGFQIKRRFPIFALILVLMAMGMGTIIELAELGAVVWFNAAQQVGDYYNNAFDLLFNTFGAVAAVIVLYFYQYPPKFIKKMNGQS